MGRDISPIGNHQLNTENVQKLAEDIKYLDNRIDICTSSEGLYNIILKSNELTNDTLHQ